MQYIVQEAGGTFRAISEISQNSVLIPNQNFLYETSQQFKLQSLKSNVLIIESRDGPMCTY